jgi:ribonuclease Y
MIVLIALLIGGLLIGALGAMIVARRTERQRVEAAQIHAAHVLRQAELQREALMDDARSDAAALRRSAEAELKEELSQQREVETRLSEKSKVHNRKSQAAADLQKKLSQLKSESEAVNERLARMDAQMLERLAEISGISVEQARDDIMMQVDRTLRDDAQMRLREAESELQEESERVSMRLLSNAVQRLSSPVDSASGASSIALSERELKRITSSPALVQRISELAGVELSLDEDAGVLSISGADAVKRELGRLSVAALLKNGRSRERDVEQLVRKQEQRLEKTIRDAAISAVRRSGCQRLPEPIIGMLGRLQYRYSYGQNQLIHAVETAHLAAMIAHELRADVEIARAGGLLHDLGKAIDREVEGTHAQIGAELALEAGLDPRIAHCIAAHHEEIDPETTEAFITIVADALSGARPGARRESLEGYLARLEALEAVALGFPGVEKCYAIQAGRELRVIVNADVVDDEGASRIAQAISARIQETMDYPGQIAVMVIRETRAVEHTH